MAGLAALAALGAHADGTNTALAFQSLDSMVVTATRSAQPQSQALRDVVVIGSEEIAEAGPFYLAEDYHQQYLDKNPNGYCPDHGTGVACPVGIGVSAE